MKAQWTIASNLQRILNTYAVEWGLTVSKVEIRLVNEAAEEYFVDNAQLLKRMQMTENSARERKNRHCRERHQPYAPFGQPAGHSFE